MVLSNRDTVRLRRPFGAKRPSTVFEVSDGAWLYIFPTLGRYGSSSHQRQLSSQACSKTAESGKSHRFVTSPDPLPLLITTMHTSTSALLLAAILGLAEASSIPPSARVQKQAFTVHQVSKGHKLKRPGAVAMMKTYHKYNKAKQAPAQVSAAAAAATKDAGSVSGQGTVAANPEAYDEVRLG